mgnify:CR=1 FL=1
MIRDERYDEKNYGRAINFKIIEQFKGKIPCWILTSFTKRTSLDAALISAPYYESNLLVAIDKPCMVVGLIFSDLFSQQMLLVSVS